MKKFFTLLCVFAVALSAVAAPQRITQLSSLTKAENKTVMAKKLDLAGMGFKKVDAAKVKALKQIEATKAPKVKKAPKATQATTDVNVLAINARYYSSYSMYVYTLVGENDLYYYFSFNCTDGNDPVANGTTYSLSDMYAYYCYWSDANDDYNYSDYTACSFTKTVDAEGFIKIVATATDDNGDTWNLLYDEANAPKLPQGGSYKADEVTFNFWEAETAGTPNDVQYILTFSEAGLEFYFDIYVADGDKDVVSGQTYTLADMNIDYTAGIFNKTVEIEIASVTFTKVASADGAYVVTAVVLDKEDNTWTLSAIKDAPQITEMTLALNGTSEIGTYFSQIEAADADSALYVSFILWGTDLEGQWTDDDLYYPTLRLATETDFIFYDMQDIDITVAWSAEQGKYILTGTAKAINENDDLDIINLTFNLAIAGDEPAAVVPSDMTFSFQDVEGGVLITPSNNEDPWDMAILTKENFEDVAEGDADYVAEYFYGQSGDTYASPGAYTMSFATAELEAGDYVLVVWGANGGITTPAAFYYFTVPSGEEVDPGTGGENPDPENPEEGIENVVLTKQAKKVVVDGSIFVIRDNKMFNLQGARVR